MAGKTTDSEYNRKTGKPVTGRVRGLEGTKLRYAEVAIGMLGPEEAPKPRGGRTRFFTHFDVMPIGPDGRFTTLPLPPGRYDLSLFAIRATTPRAGIHEGQHSDFGGGAADQCPREGRGAARGDRGEGDTGRGEAQAAKPDPRRRGWRCAPGTRPGSRSRISRYGSIALAPARSRRSASMAWPC